MKNWNPKRESRRELKARPHPAWCILAFVCGCQSYAPSPLDPAAHQVAWQARDLNDGSLTEFLNQRRSPLPGPGWEFDLSDGLNLHEARLVAIAFNPDLRLARLRAGMAAASAEHAGRWMDPEFSFSALGATDDIPDPWVVGPSISFAVPILGRAGAESEHAQAQTRAAATTVLGAEWRVWGAVWAAWQDWSAALLRVQATEALRESLYDLIQRVNALAEAGELPRTEANLFHLEYQGQAVELLRLESLARTKRQALWALMGLTPQAELSPAPYLSPLREGRTADDFFPITTRTAFTEALRHSNLELAELWDKYEISEKALDLEIARQVSDLSLGPAFESDAGQPRLGIVAGISLPLFHANRQGIATARAARLLTRAQYETTLEVICGRWAGIQDKVESLHRIKQQIELLLMPMAQQQLEQALQLMQLGEGSSLVLLESLVRAHQTKLDWIDNTLAVSAAEGEITQMRGPQTHEDSAPESSATESGDNQ